MKAPDPQYLVWSHGSASGTQQLLSWATTDVRAAGALAACAAVAENATNEALARSAPATARFIWSPFELPPIDRAGVGRGVVSSTLRSARNARRCVSNGMP